MNAYPEKQHYTADDLAAIIAILRDPDNGCPWDKVQTHRSIRMNFLEEAYEAVDAIDLDDPELLCEERRSSGRPGISPLQRSATVSAASCLTAIRTFFVGTRA